jgi:hypothetical protein
MKMVAFVPLQVAMDTAAWPLAMLPANASPAESCDLGERIAVVLKGAALLGSIYVRQDQQQQHERKDPEPTVAVAAIKFI